MLAGPSLHCIVETNREEGDLHQAIADFEAYLELNQNGPDRAQVEQLIRKMKGP